MPGKYDEEWLEREFIGYGFQGPDPKWPGGAKIAVNFVIQYNMGAVSEAYAYIYTYFAYWRPH
jgi:hypothetical protein